jgi:hypothetical protein
MTAPERFADSQIPLARAANLEKRIFGIATQKKEFRRHPD